MRKIFTRQNLGIIILALGSSVAFALPYVVYTFYDQMYEALGVTHAQLGGLMTMYGAVNMLTYIPAGWLADRVPIKKLIIFSLLGTCALNFVFGLSPTYGTALAVWFGLSITTTLTYWPALMKAVNLYAGDKQGTGFGLYEGCNGIFSMVTSFVALAAFAKTNTLSSVMYTYTVVLLVSGIGSIILLPNVDNEGNVLARGETLKVDAGKKYGYNWKEVWELLKKPNIWLASMVVFCIYGLNDAQSYLTPYMTEVIGVSVVFSGVLAIVRNYAIKFISSPVMGIVGDKVRSISKIISWVCVSCIVMLGIFFFITKDTSMTLIIVLLLVYSGVNHGVNGIKFATLREAGIPPHLTGTAVALVSVIGYLPDLFLRPLCGSFLDRFGGQGYNYIFAFMILLNVVAFVCARLIIRITKQDTPTAA